MALTVARMFPFEPGTDGHAKPRVRFDGRGGLGPSFRREVNLFTYGALGKDGIVSKRPYDVRFLDDGTPSTLQATGALQKRALLLGIGEGNAQPGCGRTDLHVF